ncbi:MAG: hypothetical protein EZS28_010855 [Streblomastix strix]|uniref:Uncharacterized protein n=1 Tax=Streblomastix strix TaxID=222440 RepID=A0A5J4WFF4_9EUKA|nr:MAG: hypothetical protein EZS28_010855 [Streblomastix strix]
MADLQEIRSELVESEISNAIKGKLNFDNLKPPNPLETLQTYCEEVQEQNEHLQLCIDQKMIEQKNVEDEFKMQNKILEDLEEINEELRDEVNNLSGQGQSEEKNINEELLNEIRQSNQILKEQLTKFLDDKLPQSQKQGQTQVKLSEVVDKLIEGFMASGKRQYVPVTDDMNEAHLRFLIDSGIAYTGQVPLFIKLTDLIS